MGNETIIRWRIDLATNYAKDYCNRTLTVKDIVENVVTCFLGGTQCSLSHLLHTEYCDWSTRSVCRVQDVVVVNWERRCLLSTSCRLVDVSRQLTTTVPSCLDTVQTTVSKTLLSMATAARPNERSRMIVFAVALVQYDLYWMNLSTEGESASGSTMLSYV